MAKSSYSSEGIARMVRDAKKDLRRKKYQPLKGWRLRVHDRGVQLVVDYQDGDARMHEWTMGL